VKTVVNLEVSERKGGSTENNDDDNNNNNNIRELQKTAVLGTAKVLR
jgi:hypothetical protein